MSIKRRAFPFVYISLIGVGVYIKRSFQIINFTKNFFISSSYVGKTANVTTTKTVSAA